MATQKPIENGGEKSASDCMQLLVRNCARCGKDHTVTFKPLTIPADEWTHWAPCPNNGEPIMMKFVPDETH